MLGAFVGRCELGRKWLYTNGQLSAAFCILFTRVKRKKRRSESAKLDNSLAAGGSRPCLLDLVGETRQACGWFCSLVDNNAQRVRFHLARDPACRYLITRHHRGQERKVAGRGKRRQRRRERNGDGRRELFRKGRNRPRAGEKARMLFHYRKLVRSSGRAISRLARAKWPRPGTALSNPRFLVSAFALFVPDKRACSSDLGRRR